MILFVYVNTLLEIGDCAAVESFKQEIKEHFNTKEEGRFDKYVGCKVARKNRDKPHMSQPNIMHKLEKEFGMEIVKICQY